MTPAMLDDARLIVAATASVVALVATWCFFATILRGERFTDRLWLISGIALTFGGMAIWGGVLGANFATSALPVGVGMLIAGQIIHLRTFTRPWVGEWGWLAWSLGLTAWALA